jgi:hypothetical protein
MTPAELLAYVAGYQHPTDDPEAYVAAIARASAVGVDVAPAWEVLLGRVRAARDAQHAAAEAASQDEDWPPLTEEDVEDLRRRYEKTKLTGGVPLEVVVREMREDLARDLERLSQCQYGDLDALREFLDTAAVAVAEGLPVGPACARLLMRVQAGQEEASAARGGSMPADIVRRLAEKVMREHAPALEALARHDERHDPSSCFQRPLCADVSVERRGERYVASCSTPKLDGEGATEEDALGALRLHVELHYEGELDLYPGRARDQHEEHVDFATLMLRRFPLVFAELGGYVARERAIAAGKDAPARPRGPQLALYGITVDRGCGR